MLRTPPSLNLPRGSVLVEDVDEEIFLLYTRKQQLASTSDASTTAGSKQSGLGSHSDKEEVLTVEIEVTNPWLASSATSSIKPAKGKRGTSSSKKGKEKEAVVVEVELHQALNDLRNRKGDTGSVLWRVSLHLATYLLRQHHFPHPSHPPLLPLLSSSSILELGSGTGFLGLALCSILSSSPPPTSLSPGAAAEKPSWTFTDQLANLPLIVRNLRAHGLDPSSASSGVEVEELDWMVESSEWEKHPKSVFSLTPSADMDEDEKTARPPALIVAADCIYNPSISAPLAHTILRRSGPETVVLVASELRDEEPLEAFLREWVDEGAPRGWRVARVAWEDEGEREAAGEVAGGQYVVWVGWQEQDEQEQ
ncbi:hypothetical protein JCM10207_000667 [Rhodosporidiobolus poonsookiae]